MALRLFGHRTASFHEAKIYTLNLYFQFRNRHNYFLRIFGNTQTSINEIIRGWIAMH